MPRGEPLDVRQEAYRLADLHLQRQGVAKAAGTDPVRDELALTLYAPVIEAVHAVLGTGPRIGVTGELVTKAAGGESPVAKAVRKNRKAHKRLRRSFERFEESERRPARGRGGPGRPGWRRRSQAGPDRPQFRELTDADLARIRFVMSKVADAEGQFIDGLQQEHGGSGHVSGGGA